jgi:hypothetical protein
MKKLLPILVLVAALLLAPGCAIQRVERYFYQPTRSVPHASVWTKQRAIPYGLQPAEGEVLLAPDFTQFSTDYSSQESFLNIFTRGNRPVFIIDAELEVVATGFKQSITLNLMTKPGALKRDKSYWADRVPLFRDGLGVYGGKNIDFSKIKGRDELLLTVRWRDGEQIVEQRFPLQRSVWHVPSPID